MESLALLAQHCLPLCRCMCLVLACEEVRGNLCSRGALLQSSRASTTTTVAEAYGCTPIFLSYLKCHHDMLA